MLYHIIGNKSTKTVNEIEYIFVDKFCFSKQKYSDILKKNIFVHNFIV